MKRVNYNDLNARQKEIYNFQKVSGIFAEFGYTTVKLSDDWMGADFIAISFDGVEYIKVQLKGRLTFEKKYIGKEIFVCFHDSQSERWYLYDHDIALKNFIANIENSDSWNLKGGYSFPYLTGMAKVAMEPYLFG